MEEVKQISKQEEMRKRYESRQVGGTEKVEQKSKEVPLNYRKQKTRKNVYKQCNGLKRNSRKIKSLQLHEAFQLQYDQERADKGSKQKEKLFQNVDEISEGRKNNTISLVERKIKILYMTNIPWKSSQRKRKMN